MGQSMWGLLGFLMILASNLSKASAIGGFWAEELNVEVIFIYNFSIEVWTIFCIGK